MATPLPWYILMFTYTYAACFSSELLYCSFSEGGGRVSVVAVVVWITNLQLVSLFLGVAVNQ